MKPSCLTSNISLVPELVAFTNSADIPIELLLCTRCDYLGYMPFSAFLVELNVILSPATGLRIQEYEYSITCKHELEEIFMRE